MRLVRERERAAKTGVPKSSWRELMAAGKAPMPVRIGPQAVAWVESELDEWIAERVRAREAESA